MGKRIFALGGAGAIGAECTRELLAARDVETVTIGEIDVAKAESLAEDIGDSRVRVAKVDVRDVHETALAVEGHDVIMNSLFWGWFDQALAAACAARIDYADLLSHPTDRHRAMAQDAGITAVSGLGASPGIGNVMGRRACDTFEVPQTLEISCTSFRSVAPSPGLLDTLIAILTPQLPERGYHLLGRFVRTAPLEGSKLVDFGPPVGKLMVYYINHSETFSFPRHFPTLQYVAVRGTYRPKLMEDFRIIGSYGLLDNEQQPAGNTSVNIREVVRDRIWATWGERDDPDAYHLFLHVEATGRTGDRLGCAVQRVRHTLAWGSKAIGRMTGLGAAIGALTLARQGRTMTGIVDPEQYFDAQVFMKELASREGITVEEYVDWDLAS